MRHRSRIVNIPVRVATGAFIVNSGFNKLKAEKETAHRLHDLASGAYPVLENVPPEQFVKMLGGAEIALGGALLAPVVVGDGLAGLALSSFAGTLLGLYVKTPSLRREGSIRPSQQGTAIAKDSWLVGSGLTLVMSSIAARRTRRRARRARARAQGALAGS